MRPGSPLPAWAARRRVLGIVMALWALTTALLLGGCGGSGGTGNTSEAGPSASAGGGSEGAEAPIGIDLELDWIASPNHTVLFWAKNQGYFEKNGVDVNLIPPSDATAPLKLTATEKVDLAITYEPEVIEAAQQGLAVKAVGAVFPRPLANFTALAQSEVKTPADLDGKAVGYSGIPTFKAYAKTELASAGLTESDVELTNVGFNLVPALLSENVAAITEAYSTNEVITIWDETGEKPTTIPVSDLGVPPYDELLFIANSSRLASDAGYADAVKRFLKAYYEAYEDVKTKPDEATKMMEGEVDYPTDFIEKAVPVSLKEMAPEKGDEPGCFSLGAWKKYGEWMMDEGLVKTKPDLQLVVSNEYLPTDCEES